MLTSLRHGAVSSGTNENSAVHLGSTGDHIFHIISVPGAVNVSVVTIFGLILDVCCRNCDTTLALLGCTVDLVVGTLFSKSLISKSGGDSSSQRGFAVVNVTNRTHIHVRLVTFE